MDRENFRRAESERHVRKQRGKEGDEHGREQSPDERGSERGSQRLATLTLPGQRVTVKRGRHRPGLARDVEEHGGDGAAEQRSPINGCQQDDRRGRRHPQGERQQDSDAIGAAQTGQHADDRAKNDPDGGVKQVLLGQSLLEPEKNIFQPHQ